MQEKTTKFEDFEFKVEGDHYHYIHPATRQVGGDHYTNFEIQPGHFCQVNRIPHYEANVIKYVCRHRRKGGAEDIRKAIHYLEMLLEQEYKEKPIPNKMRISAKHFERMQADWKDIYKPSFRADWREYRSLDKERS
jgi:hypothetical protein